MFALTNIDDLLILAVLFAKAERPAKVVAGQYLGFAAILAVALGVGLPPEGVVPWLGLIPIALGIKAALTRGDEESQVSQGVLATAGLTFANGGDNIGVYVPVFATTGHVWVFVAVFLALVGIWCPAGWLLATRPFVARSLARWGHVLLPVVLIAIGVLILFRL